MRLRVRFGGGELRGCVDMTTTPRAAGGHGWDGPGSFFQASPALRRYIPLSLRFSGVTRAGDPGHVRGGFVTDAPTGLRCLPF
jgi:hypothetical protein